jgi:hypothetical protein
VSAVTFGDLLYVAAGHLAAAVTSWDQQARDPQAAAWQLRRATEVLTRYADGMTPWEQAETLDRTDLVWWQRAGTEIARSLHLAAGALDQGIKELGGPPGAPEPAPGFPLDAAVTGLAAARDLLYTHLTVSPDDSTAPRTEWAATARSAQVFRTMTDLAASWSEQLGQMAGQLAVLQPGDSVAGPQFAAAGQWLRLAGASAWQARAVDPVSAGDHTLLFAIPPAATAQREAPRPAEARAELCRGITLSASRLQASARGSAQQALWSPGSTAGAWRWTATAGAVTSHLSAALLRSVARRAGPLGLPREQLRAAMHAMAAAQARWHHVAGQWGHLTTETRFLASGTVTEASDLLVRLGRLACDNPAWTPAAVQRAPLRDPALLAPDEPAAAGIVAAVHHSACAFECVAAADLESVQAATRAQRLFVPTRTLSEPSSEIGRAYVVAPEGQTWPLIQAYRSAVTASARAAQALDQAALAIGAPSQFMAQAREARREQERRSGPRSGLWGPVETEILQLGIRDAGLLRRAATIDAAARTLVAEAANASAGFTPPSGERASPGRRRGLASPDFPDGLSVPVPSPPGGRRRRPPQGAGRARSGPAA